eukprot:CAMPEP_0185175968 /NCGR_PEP_ID=MMETSP1139-20130426/27609_1 /TAXON_ID=298111 /ORGANISM="Pavlova sp., Strain CCMP459" /LENGTH=51 /DNA_ID=CAMNT_0027741713 /DNA_START=21 /DNA_END=172 /DNA_ORIENTATION=+
MTLEPGSSGIGGLTTGAWADHDQRRVHNCDHNAGCNDGEAHGDDHAHDTLL